MQFEAINSERETEQISLRFFKDQLEKLIWVCQVKYRGRLNRSDVVRLYVDRGLDQDIKGEVGA